MAVGSSGFRTAQDCAKRQRARGLQRPSVYALVQARLDTTKSVSTLMVRWRKSCHDINCAATARLLINKQLTLPGGTYGRNRATEVPASEHAALVSSTCRVRPSEVQTRIGRLLQRLCRMVHAQTSLPQWSRKWVQRSILARFAVRRSSCHAF